MFKLQFVDNRQPAMWLVDQRLTIGRDKNNGLVIDDEGLSVFHAELRQDDGKLFVWDCGSVNGTFLNGEKVAQKAEVKAGDVIRFHLVEILISDPSKGPAPVLPVVKRDVEKPALPQWQLKAMSGAISGKMFLIDGTTVLGRDPGCDIIITGPHVSRRHAEISIRSGQLWMKDLGSSNGSFLNGKRSEESMLKHGDEVKFDAVIFKVVGPSEPVDSVDEADMTQFRPAIAAKPAAPAPTPVAKPAVPVAPAPVAKVEPATPAVAKPAAPKPAAPAPVPSAPASSGGPGLGPLVLVVLVVLAALALFFILA
ncbi:MAG: FHA domain-containing protein [Moraxellaceae bacterium]|nr:FHA domain-containing protein [Moraxellaceae bacterium]